MSSFELVDPPARGVPVPRYFKPLVRINALTQDAPFNWKLDPCYFDTVALAAAVAPLVGVVANQTLSLVGDQLSISGGNTVTLPASSGALVVGAAPPVVQDAPIPSDQVGSDAYLLGAPAVWLRVTIAGVDYAIPGYAIPLGG